MKKGKKESEMSKAPPAQRDRLILNPRDMLPITEHRDDVIVSKGPRHKDAGRNWILTLVSSSFISFLIREKKRKQTQEGAATRAERLAMLILGYLERGSAVSCVPDCLPLQEVFDNVSIPPTSHPQPFPWHFLVLRRTRCKESLTNV